MGSPVIWYADGTKALNNKLYFQDGKSIEAGSVNPAVTATDGLAGSLYISGLTSSTYVKQDNGSSTNWNVLDDASNEIPSGGSTGQALVKVSNANYDVEWATISAGITQLTGGVTAGPGTGSQVATVVTNANLTGPITSVGNATSVDAQTGTGSVFVMQASPTLTTPNLGTPSTLVGTNISGTAPNLTAGAVTPNPLMSQIFS